MAESFKNDCMNNHLNANQNADTPNPKKVFMPDGTSQIQKVTYVLEELSQSFLRTVTILSQLQTSMHHQQSTSSEQVTEGKNRIEQESA